MRTGLLVSMLVTFCVGALLAETSYSQGLQDVKIKLEAPHTSLKDILKEIERRTKYRFAYNNDEIERIRPVVLPAALYSVKEILDRLLAGTGLVYRQVEKSIVITRPRPDRDDERTAPGTRPAAGHQVKGVVLDENGEALPGVNVVLKGTGLGTITDVQGSFSLEIPELPGVLQFSFIGYLTEEVTVSGEKALQLRMRVDQRTLDELVVVGYGSQKRRDLTGAISSISARDIAETPSSNFLANAQGRLAGVDIVRSGGAPGAGFSIRIRGNRSINASNEPLYVIDGIPTDVNINDFNPNDIESMEVLKDASAVAIYGSRGANGVILITTKKGKEGKAVISYDGYYGVKKANKQLRLMDGNRFAQYARVARGLEENDSSKDATFLSAPEVDNLAGGRYTNWLDLILRDGIQQSHQVSASGGSPNTVYYLSGAVFDERGVLRKSDYRRYAFRLNVESKLTKRLKVGVSANVSSDIQHVMSDAPYSNALSFSPLISPYDAEGRFVAYPNPREGNATNPLLEYQENQYVDERKKHRIFANIYGEYKILEGLTYRLNFGPDLSIYKRGTYTGTLAGSVNTASVENRQNFAYTLENIVNYDRKWRRHAMSLVGLFSVQESSNEESKIAVRDIPVETSSFHDLGSAVEVTGKSSALTRWGLLSWMGRLNYSWSDKYLLTVTGRADGSSRLSKGNKWAFFPSVSAGWVLSEESFLKQAKALSFLKIRAGYGQVGNTSINSYQTLGGLERSAYVFGTEPGFGYALSVIANPDLRWEISRTLNAGIDFGLWNDRINGSLEIYNTRTGDLLLSRLIPITSGYTSVLQNIGSTRNAGWELTLNGSVLQTPSGFRWDANLNVFSNKERIVELFNGQDDDVGNLWFIGKPIQVFYSYRREGIWQTSEVTEAEKWKQQPGDIKIADVNGRDAAGNLTDRPDGKINADDRTVLGSTVPDWSGGITNRFSFKGLDFSFLVYARQGQFLRSDFHNLGGNQWQGRYNSLDFNYWTKDNPSGDIPRPNAAQAPLYADAVRYFDGSFVKIRNITLGYSFPQGLLSKMGISSLRVYGTADNAFIFSRYKLVDPETSNGIVGGSTPLTSATYVFGVNLRF